MRIEQLTFTRFIAAIAIVFFHFGKDIWPYNTESISFIFNKANVGVSYFFILSGFVMIIAYHKNNKISAITYLKNRFARIYPIYIFALFLYVLSLYANHKNVGIKSFILNFTMLQSWRPGRATTMNYPGWSISVEFFFYALFPLLYNKFYSKLSFKINAIWIIAIFIVSQILMHVLLFSSFYDGYPSNSHDFIFYFPAMHLNEFLLGSLAGLYFLKYVKPKNYDFQILGLSILLLLALKFNIGLSYHNGLLAFIFVPLIVLISANKSKITTLFKHKTLVFLGEISFGLYILQAPVFKFSSWILKSTGITDHLITFNISLALLLIISGITYTFIEVPFRKKIRKLNFK